MELNLEEGNVLLVDKPLGFTSFQIVNKIRWDYKQKLGIKKLKVGHAGTLDPLATGLLIVCVGKKTKIIDAFLGLDKTYTGCFTLGATRPSYDLETEINQTFPTDHITKEDIMQAALQLKNTPMQIPPLFSAKNIEGKRAYKLARKGIEKTLEARPITLHQFDIEKIEMPHVYFKVHCSKGTYIRSLAFDFGKILNSGAYLSALRRTKIGEYSIKNAVPYPMENTFPKVEVTCLK